MIQVVLSIIRKLGYTLLPIQYKLPFFFWLTLKTNKCENELKQLDSIVQGNKVSIDIGANLGLYSYRLAQLFSKVYSFEINSEMTKDLHAYGSPKINIINVGLSSKEEYLTFYIPVVKNRAQTGWAGLDKANYPSPDRLLERKVLVSALDSYGIKEVEFIKIDVEGHEIEVLQGALTTITENRPILLIEIKNKNLPEVQKYFSNLNYLQLKLEDLIDIPSSEENYIFVPSEKYSERSKT